MTCIVLYIYLLVPLRVTRLPSCIPFSVFTSFFLPYLHSSFLLTYFLSLPPVLHSLIFSTFFSARFATPRTPRPLSFLLSILHSNLFSTLSYLSPHASPRPPRSLHLSYLPILMFHSYFLLLYMFIHFLYIFLYTVSFPSPFDFRFSIIRSILTFILVPLLSRLRFFVFWPFLFPLSILRLFLPHLVFPLSFPPSFSPPPFSYCIYLIHVPMILPKWHVKYKKKKYYNNVNKIH